MEFLESPRFPGCPSFGFTSTPMFATDVTRVASGRETRNRNWSRPLHRFDVEVGPRLQEDIEAVSEFFYAVGGQECGFRFKDYADFKSCALSAAPSHTDQPLLLIAADTSDPVYQLTKRYTAGSRSQDRDILKPVEDTILIGRDGSMMTSGYTLDPTTGTVIFDDDQTGHTLTWGGEFDVPVRFESDQLPRILSNKHIQNASFGLIELRDP